VEPRVSTHSITHSLAIRGAQRELIPQGSWTGWPGYATCTPVQASHIQAGRPTIIVAHIHGHSKVQGAVSEQAGHDLSE
jgi:hypothetical protein